jgi:FkbM family methyltransferase
MKNVLKALTPPILWTLGRHIKIRSDKSNLIKEEQGAYETKHGQFHYENIEAFQCLYHDYFVKEKYKFDTRSPKPFIIDGGDNIGVGCRYWKFLYPESEVIAFEPDENNFSLLQKNMTSYSEFKAEKKALWSSHGTLKFHAVGGESGHVADANSTAAEHGIIEVSAYRLRDLLDRKVDLLKLDIEGGEMEVLRDCKDLLGNVERIFVEHHSFLAQPQQLGEFFGILENAGFRLNIHVDFQARQPFLKRLVYNNKDCWLNVFGFRE